MKNNVVGTTTLAALGLLLVVGMLTLPSEMVAQQRTVVLFDGKTLDGWHKPTGVPEDYRGGTWEVVDGVLVGDQDPPGMGGFLVTDGIYRDYVIEFDISMDDPADSGVFPGWARMGRTTS